MSMHLENDCDLSSNTVLFCNSLGMMQVFVWFCAHPSMSPGGERRWFDLNFLSLTPFSTGMMSHKIAEHTNRYVIKVQNGHHNFFPTIPIFMRKNSVNQHSILDYNKPTYKQFQVIFEFALEKYVTSCYS